MSSPSIYVDSPSKIEEVIGVCGSVKFVSLLTTIESRNEFYCLEMNNFENGSSDSIPYQPTLPKKNADCARSAKMVIELICNWFNLDLPELQNDLPFTRSKIHTSSLCFLECKVLYISAQENRNQDRTSSQLSDGNYLGYLESIKPISIDKAQELALEASTDVGKTIHSILQNLETMKQNISSSFSLSLARQRQINNQQALPPTQRSVASCQLENSKSRTSDYNISNSQNTIRSTSFGTSGSFTSINPIAQTNRMSSADSQTEQNRLRTSSSNLNNTSCINPMFRGEKFNPVESQFDFNSINTQNDEIFDSEEELEIDLKEKSEKEYRHRPCLDATSSPPISLGKPTSYSHHTDQLPPYKRIKRTRTRVDPIYSNAEDGEILVLKGTFIAVHPLENLIYFLPQGFERPPHLCPGINCIEIESNAMPLDKEYTIKIERTEREIVKNKFTLTWVLKSPTPPSPATGVQCPLIWFKDLKLQEKFQHYRMIALLVSSDFKTRGDFASVIFTDFTKSDLRQYKLFDKFIIDFNNKLGDDEGIRTLFFPEHYQGLNKSFEKAYGKTIEQTRAPESFNHTASRIVCLLTLRAKVYHNTLNAIPYRYEIIRPELVLALDERRHLFQLYQKAIETRNVHLLGENLPPYEVPDINADISDYSLTYCSNSVDLQKASDSFLRRLESSSASFPSPLQTDNECFAIDATILCFLTDDNNIDHWTLLVTIDNKDKDKNNNVITDDRIVDPTSILRIEIFGRENLQYFTAKQAHGSTTAPNSTISTTLQQNLAKYHGKKCKLRLKRGYITLRSEITLLIWCPIELTLEELGIKLEENPSKILSQVNG